MQDLYPENYKTLLKEIKEKLNKDILCSEIGRLNIVMMATLPKLIYRFITIPIKNSAGFSLSEIDQLILKFR